MEQRIKQVIARVFHVPLDQVSDDASAYTIENWDSLKHIDLVLSLQKEFGIRFEDDEIPTLTNYQIILNTIKAYLE